jgi:mRNA-degrading endonuclease RelE of RelBE toxin-antitoxin system
MPDEVDNTSSVEIFFTGEFKRNLRQLAKKYRHIKADVQPILDDIENGQTPGDRIPGVQFEVYKVRARNSDSARGKSGGYRIIYQRTLEMTVILITIYSKTEQSDISPQEIQSIINHYEPEQQETETTKTASETIQVNPDQQINPVRDATELDPDSGTKPSSE